MIGAKGFYKLTVIKTLVSLRRMGLIFEKLICRTLHPEKLASKKFGYLACDR